jgi:hypothetical protein
MVVLPAPDSHQCRECTGLNPAIHVIQDAPRLSLDLDVVAHVAPVEGACGAPKGSLDAGYVPTRFPYNCYRTGRRLLDIIAPLGRRW